MSEEKKGHEEPIAEELDKQKPRVDKNVFEEFGESVGKFATRTFESLKTTIDRSMSTRNTVLTIRVSDETNRRLNMLVEAGIFKTRSEGAAYFIEEGIKHQDKLFEKISEKLKKIDLIREELKGIVASEITPAAPQE